MTVSREQTKAKLDLLASGVTRHVPEQTYLPPRQRPLTSLPFYDDPLFVLDKNQASYVPDSDSALAKLGVEPFLPN